MMCLNSAGKIVVCGPATIGDGITINALTVTGGMAVTGGLTVDHIVITGDSTLNDLTITGNETITGSLSADSLIIHNGEAISGGSIITGGLSTDSLSIINGLTVGGGASIAGGETVTGGLTVDNLEITDNTYFNNLTVNGDEIVTGNEMVTGSLTSNSLAVTAGATIGGNETVTGSLTIGSGETLTGNLGITGNETLTGSLTIGGGETLTGNLGITGNETLTGTLTVHGAEASLNVANNTALLVLAGRTGMRVTRLGFATAGDGGNAVYDWSAVNCVTADNGAQVQPTAITGCWVADFSGGPPSVKIWGAKGDCATDDGPAFVAALALGIPIHAPSGHYLIATGGTYSAVPVYLTGDGYEEYGLVYGAHCDLTKKGTYLVQTAPSTSIFTMSGAAVRGSTFTNFAVAQVHPAPGAGWSPTVYPPVWSLISTLGTTNISHIGLGGIYAVIDSTLNSARTTFTDIKGQVFSYLFRNDYSLDISRASDIHMWPFWSADAGVMDWQITNTDVIRFGRQDGFQMDRFFSLGAHSCVRLSQWTTGTYVGAPTAIDIGSLNCDVTKYSIWIDSTANLPVIRVNDIWHGGGRFDGTPITGGSVIQIDGAGALVQIHDINVLFVEHSVINQTNVGVGSQVQIGGISAGAFPTSGWNFSGGVAYAGISPVISDISPEDGHSVYSIAHPIFPQNAGANAASGFSSGVINTNSKAELYMASEDQGWYELVVADGATYTWPNWATVLILNGGAPTVTIKLPKSPLDGRLITMTCDNAITTLNVQLSAGSLFTLLNPPTTCTAGQSFQFKTTLAGTPAIRTLK
jgi:hypothetical protein